MIPMEIIDAIVKIIAVALILTGVFGMGVVCGVMLRTPQEKYRKQRSCSHKNVKLICADCGHEPRNLERAESVE